MNKKILFFVIILLFLNKNIYSKISSGGKLNYYYSYYSFILNRKEKIIYGNPREIKFYLEQFKKSLKPEHILVEFASYPLPYFSHILRKSSLYNDFELSENFHLLKSLSAGYEEPWAVTLLLGNIWGFKHPRFKNKFQGVSYMGFLFSFGNKQLFSNVMFSSRWLEIEWKIKGVRYTFFDKKEWNFNIGFKKQSSPLIADTFYFNIFRDNTLYVKRYKKAFLPNLRFEFKTEFDVKNGELISNYFLIGKKFQIKKKKFFIIEIGYLYQKENKIKFEEKEEEFQFILRPNIEF